MYAHYLYIIFAQLVSCYTLFNSYICNQPKISGDCRRNPTVKPSLRWYYVPERFECLAFEYVGCGGNRNNFENKTKCQRHCAPADRPHCSGNTVPFKAENGDTMVGKDCATLRCPKNWQCRRGFAIATCCNATVEGYYESAHNTLCPNGNSALVIDNGDYNSTVLAASCEDLGCPHGFNCVQINPLFAKCCQDDGKDIRKSTDFPLIFDAVFEKNYSDCQTTRSQLLLTIGFEAGLNENDIHQTFVPECRDDGSFESLQCNHFRGLCWCVNTFTGNEIPNTRSSEENPPKCDACLVQREQAVKLLALEFGLNTRKLDETPEFQVPACKANGDFEPQQCNTLVNFCWCVHEKSGIEIPGTRSSVLTNTVHCGGCKAHKETIQIQLGFEAAFDEPTQLDVFVPECSDDRHYAPLQCNTAIGQCWCVDTMTGKEKSGTRSGLGDEFFCEGCEQHRKKALAEVTFDIELKEDPDNIFVPKCQRNGLFEPTQCNGRECWCVDIIKGTQIPFTRTPIHLPPICEGPPCFDLESTMKCLKEFSHILSPLLPVAATVESLCQAFDEFKNCMSLETDCLMPLREGFRKKFDFLCGAGKEQYQDTAECFQSLLLKTEFYKCGSYFQLLSLIRPGSSTGRCETMKETIKCLKNVVTDQCDVESFSFIHSTVSEFLRGFDTRCQLDDFVRPYTLLPTASPSITTFGSKPTISIGETEIPPSSLLPVTDESESPVTPTPTQSTDPLVTINVVGPSGEITDTTSPTYDYETLPTDFTSSTEQVTLETESTSTDEVNMTTVAVPHERPGIPSMMPTLSTNEVNSTTVSQDTLRSSFATTDYTASIEQVTLETDSALTDEVVMTTVSTSVPNERPDIPSMPTLSINEVNSTTVSQDTLQSSSATTEQVTLETDSALTDEAVMTTVSTSVPNERPDIPSMSTLSINEVNSTTVSQDMLQSSSTTTDYTSSTEQVTLETDSALTDEVVMTTVSTSVPNERPDIPSMPTFSINEVNSTTESNRMFQSSTVTVTVNNLLDPTAETELNDNCTKKELKQVVDCITEIRLNWTPVVFITHPELVDHLCNGICSNIHPECSADLGEIVDAICSAHQDESFTNAIKCLERNWEEEEDETDTHQHFEDCTEMYPLALTVPGSFPPLLTTLHCGSVELFLICLEETAEIHCEKDIIERLLHFHELYEENFHPICVNHHRIIHGKPCTEEAQNKVIQCDLEITHQFGSVGKSVPTSNITEIFWSHAAELCPAIETHRRCVAWSNCTSRGVEFLANISKDGCDEYISGEVLDIESCTRQLEGLHKSKQCLASIQSTATVAAVLLEAVEHSDLVNEDFRCNELPKFVTCIQNELQRICVPKIHQFFSDVTTVLSNECLTEETTKDDISIPSVSPLEFTETTVPWTPPSLGGSCFEARQKAIAKKDKQLPQCQITGQYHLIQCDVQGYCQCVDPDTGNPIDDLKIGPATKLPKCGVEKVISCKKEPQKKICPVSGKKPQKVFRWYRHEGICKQYLYTYCTEDAFNSPYTVKRRKDCEKYCFIPDFHNSVIVLI